MMTLRLARLGALLLCEATLCAAGPPGVPRYNNSRVLGRLAPVSLALDGSEAAADLALDSPVAAPLLHVGRTRLITVHAVAAGALVACVSAPSDHIGTVDGVNLGVNVKSVAVLLDDRWQPAPATEWRAIARVQTHFANWENCGAKLEGRPSPASILIAEADGGYTDDINDGNPATTFNIVPRRYGATAVAAMLSPAGDAGPMDSRGDMRLHLSILQGPEGHLLVAQGIPRDEADIASRGYIAVYVETTP